MDDGVSDSSVDELDNAPDRMNRSVLRAMALLSRLGDFPDGATVADLALATGLPRPTVFRLLLTMAHSGLLVKEEGRFALGWEVARLGKVADPRRGMLPRVQMVVDRLVGELNETVAYSVVTGPTTSDLVVEVVSKRWLSSNQRYMGRQLPLHASATGKVLLASLTDEQVVALLPSRLTEFTPFTITDRTALLHELNGVRERGFATLDNELEDGLFALGMGVYDTRRDLIGILAVSGTGQRMKSRSVHYYVEEMRRATAEIAQNLA